MSKSVLEKDSEKKHILDELQLCEKKQVEALQKNDPISFVHG